MNIKTNAGFSHNRPLFPIQNPLIFQIPCLVEVFSHFHLWIAVFLEYTVFNVYWMKWPMQNRCWES